MIVALYPTPQENYSVFALTRHSSDAGIRAPAQVMVDSLRKLLGTYVHTFSPPRMAEVYENLTGAIEMLMTKERFQHGVCPTRRNRGRRRNMFFKNKLRP
jgi:hypothetical protein